MPIPEELEDFELVVEQLEEAARLARTDSPLKCRRALILLDNLGEILTYRFCQARYRGDFELVEAFPPKLSRSRWRKILGGYPERLNACHSEFDIVSDTDWAILRIGHHYRNASYHRDFHNKASVAVLARLMREAVCRLFSTVYANSYLIGGALREYTEFLAPYGLQGDTVDFPEVSSSIARRLLNGETLDSRYVRDVLPTDICDRVERLVTNRKRWWPSMTDAKINEGMKWSEFQRKHPAQIDAIWQPARELTYLMMEVIREVDRPVSANDFDEAFESSWRRRTGEDPQKQLSHSESIKSRCREEERLAFDAFEGAHKWESLQKIRARANQLRNVGDVGACLDRYFALDLQLGAIEQCFEDVTNALDAAAQFRYDLERDK
jgi:hypothetical protein